MATNDEIKKVMSDMGKRSQEKLKHTRTKNEISEMRRKAQRASVAKRNENNQKKNEDKV